MRNKFFKKLTAAVAAVTLLGSAFGGLTLTASAEDVITYYSQDYENATTADWTTGTSGRYTPKIVAADTVKRNTTAFLSVDQNSRYNNGATLTSTALSSKISAGTNFTMTFDMILGAANGGSPAFAIYDASNTSAMLKIKSKASYSTTWMINDSTVNTVALSGTDNKQDTNDTNLDSYTWYTYKVTRYGTKTYLTITDTSTKSVILARTLIDTLSSTGGSVK